MNNRPSSSLEDKDSIKVQISDLQYRLSDTLSPNATTFEPQNSLNNTDTNTNTKTSYDSTSLGHHANPNQRLFPTRAPEKKLTLFALRLAVLEKTATGLGTLGFIWATVVLLGGFAITLDPSDFWFITTILLVEGTRIFSRSHELEWQHQATWSFSGLLGLSSFRAHHHRHRRRRRRSFTGHVSKALYWLQILSATACVVLSAMKILRRDFGEAEKGDTDKRNRKAALLIFYSLALAEALCFLLEKAYWEWKVTVGKLLEQVSLELEMGSSGLASIRRFFYDAYSRCVNGSIFDGLKMDMVGFGMDLLGSGSPDEQLIGARILRQLAISERYSDETARKIALSLEAVERLVEMLNWADPREEESRRCAAEVVSRLAGKGRSGVRVAGVPGSMESVSSLLQTGRGSAEADEVGERGEGTGVVACGASYGFWEFNNLGLLILKKLARDHDICGKIGTTRGLLPKIVDFTHAGERLLSDDYAAPSQVQAVKRALQVVKRLAGTAGPTGKQLRREISEIIFTVSNIRDILRHGHKQPVLQRLGIEILSSLALEEDATERIGGTGGVLKGLFGVFFGSGPEGRDRVRRAAGEALAMLVVESQRNCERVLRLGVLERLVSALDEPLLRVNAARILSNLCTYVGSDGFWQLKGVTIAAPTVLKAIMTGENKLQEVMVGLASNIFKLMDSQESSLAFERANVTESELASALVRILKNYPQPHIKTPRIRRFTIELSIWMMRDRASSVMIFRDLGFGTELEGVLETTGELESFNMFSGTVGMSRHGTTIHSLVETALSLLNDG